MTKYDTTGPVRVNERISFAIFSALLITTAIGLWLGLELNDFANRPQPAPPTPPAPVAASQPAPPPVLQITPTTRRAGEITDGVNRTPDGPTIIKAGDTVVAIYQTDTNVWATRTPPRDNPDSTERWQFANIANGIARDPKFAERFDAANVSEKLRSLNLRPPRLTPTQVNQIRDLYLAAQDANGDDRMRADQALHDAVAAMPIPPAEQQAFDNAVNAARAMLTPHQLELIRTGGKKELPNRPIPVPSTRPAAPAATTSRPLTPKGGQ